MFLYGSSLDEQKSEEEMGESGQLHVVRSGRGHIWLAIEQLHLQKGCAYLTYLSNMHACMEDRKTALPR